MRAWGASAERARTSRLIEIKAVIVGSLMSMKKESDSRDEQTA
jgi:hypothetical protein